jgi:nitrite reductase/ring-hydroxylating ferredoxin subunit
MPLTDFPESKPVQISHGDSHVLIVKLGDSFHAMNDVCPHRGAFIGSGPLEGTVVTCPWHGWAFDVVTGECLTNPNACQRKFAVVLDNGMVMVELPED